MEFLGSQAMESCEVQEIQYETLPSLERTPQVSSRQNDRL